jgi:hypothetical protein
VEDDTRRTGLRTGLSVRISIAFARHFLKHPIDCADVEMHVLVQTATCRSISAICAEMARHEAPPELYTRFALGRP